MPVYNFNNINIITNLYTLASEYGLLFTFLFRVFTKIIFTFELITLGKASSVLQIIYNII